MKHFCLGRLSAVSLASVSLASVSLAGAICLSVSSARADPNICIPPNAALTHTEFSAARAGGNAIRITGDQAERFLYYLNEKVGRSTEIWGDGVIIGHYPALGYDTVAIIDDECVDESKLITLDSRVASLAFAASEDPNF